MPRTSHSPTTPSTTPTQRPSITLKRVYRASVERVWQAWTEAEVLKQWFGPSSDVPVLSAETDLRTGGRYRIVMQAGGGEQHRVSGTYREVEPHRRLVFTWAWESTPERESLVTIEIAPADGGTRLTLTHEMFFDEAARDRHEQGWKGSLTRLEALLADTA